MTDRSTNVLIENNSIEMKQTKPAKGILKRPTNYLLRGASMNRSSGERPFILEKKVTF